MERILNRGPSTAFALGAVLSASAVLALMGLLVILSITVVPAEERGQAPFEAFWKQAAWITVAVCACAVLSRLDYRSVAKRGFWMLAATWVLLGIALLSRGRMGATRWITVGPVTFQPSEIAKVALLLFCGHHCLRNADRLQSFRRTVLPAVVAVLVTVGLVVVEPDYGTSLFLFVVAAILLAVGGVAFRHLLPFAALALPLMLVLVLSKFSHVEKRIQEFLDPTAGSHVDIALTTLASGGLFGRGIGEGRSHLFFLPMVQNDFVLASVGEQFGFVGTALVAVLYLIIFWQGLRIAYRAADGLGFSIAFGAVFMIALQAAINFAVVTGSAPAKGISLPFLSAGGSSLLAFGILLGLLASVARMARGVPDAVKDRRHWDRNGRPEGAAPTIQKTGVFSGGVLPMCSRRTLSGNETTVRSNHQPDANSPAAGNPGSLMPSRRSRAEEARTRGSTGS